MLEVLDRPVASSRSQEMELLGLFASQAAIALDLLQRARDAEAALAGDGNLAVVARLAGALADMDEEAQAGRAGGCSKSLETVFRRK